MFIDQLINADALSTLDAAMQFSARRQELIAHNIANATTPNFVPMDVSPAGFQAQLASAVARQREERAGSGAAPGPGWGRLDPRGTSEVEVSSRGRGQFRLTLDPGTASGNILFHDRNNRDLERMMQDLAENAAAFRVASELFRSQLSTLRTAISGRGQ